MADPRRSELADFLRSRRERLSPAAVGLPNGRRRRTPGLRREEVAELAGIGIDWYIRLEQGRSVSPSVTTVDALARALRLGPVEHAHLRALTRDADQRAFVPETVPGAIRRTVEGLHPPAYVTGRRWDILAWNAAAAELFAFDRLPAEDRNTLVSVLTKPAARQLFGAGWAAEARRMVAQFRSTHDLWAGDPAFLDLLRRLRQGCPEFAGWWEAHDVHEARSGEKLLHHPRRGLLRCEYATFQANDDPALKLAIYTVIEPTDS
ncbi:helix-turn-helix transcriptional regulator [Paracraurococcus ruber]|uniref:Transcriptional regulator n=1 Tax=Paracraurococcus ruber TaxID=77675 RepID=A0ABS1D415_9PROT|nr:helix-turn-helix transcriptional regulator [Paracraurococcus ruber]MBK1661206.1 transcriptional regulator [Paracraurococcus ruber]TDG26838.1 XRE family transcriptional regulator [Paracraurococcus ruber]